MVIKFRQLCTLVIVGFLFASPLLLPNVARAACNYSNTIDSDKYSLLTGGNFNVKIKVKKDGDLTDCKVVSRAYLYFKGASNPRIQYGIQELKYSGENAEVNFNVDLTKLDRAFYATSSSLQFKTEIWAVGTGKVSESGFLTVNVTGSTTATGAVKSNIYFQVEGAPTQKASYVKDDKVRIAVNIPNKSEINNLDSAFTKIFLVATVNGKKVGEFEQSRSNMVSSDQFFSGITVSTQNGFKDGSNSVIVEMFVAGTNTKLSTATAALQATGLGTASGGGGNTEGGTKGNTEPATGNTEPGTTGGTSGGPVEQINSPIGIGSIGELISVVIRWMLTLVGALSVLFIIIGGIKMVTSAGNESAVKSGKNTVTWAVIGLVVSLMAFTIVSALQSVLGRK